MLVAYYYEFIRPNTPIDRQENKHLPCAPKQSEGQSSQQQEQPLSFPLVKVDDKQNFTLSTK